jgi:hypothetical protein
MTFLALIQIENLLARGSLSIFNLLLIRARQRVNQVAH